MLPVLRSDASGLLIAAPDDGSGRPAENVFQKSSKIALSTATTTHDSRGATLASFVSFISVVSFIRQDLGF